MTPKQYIKYVKWLEKNNLAICDGISEPFNPGIVEYILFIASVLGIGLFAYIHWKLAGRKK